jgi:quinolinate synthase
MIKHLDKTKPSRVVMITECSMSDNVAVEFPQIEFVRPCALCPHMKRITLPKILHSLEAMEYKVEVDEEVAVRARRAVERMLEIKRDRNN